MDHEVEHAAVGAPHVVVVAVELQEELPFEAGGDVLAVGDGVSGFVLALSLGFQRAGLQELRVAAQAVVGLRGWGEGGLLPVEVGFEVLATHVALQEDAKRLKAEDTPVSGGANP